MKICQTDTIGQMIACNQPYQANIYDLKAIFVPASNTDNECEQTASFILTENSTKVKSLCKYNSDRSICELPYASYRVLFISNTAVSDMYNRVPIRYDLFYSCTNSTTNGLGTILFLAELNSNQINTYF